MFAKCLESFELKFTIITFPDLGNFSLKCDQTFICHGGLRQFGSETVKNTPAGLELLMEDLGSLGLRLSRIPPPSGLYLLMED